MKIIAILPLIALVQADQPTIRSKDGNILFESPGGICFGVQGTPAGFAQYKGDQGDQGPIGPAGAKGDQGPAGRDGIQGKDGVAGKDYNPTDTSTLVLGVVRDPVFAMGYRATANPGSKIMGPTGGAEEREVLIGGVGFHQFSNFALDDVFKCTFTDPEDDSKVEESDLTGVVATQDAATGTTHFNVACTVPQWNVKWTQKAIIDLFFGKQSVAFKGVPGGNVITFTEGVTSFSFDGEGNVLVHCVGLDVRETYSCVFKVAELGDGVSFRTISPKPSSSKQVNCGKVPNVQGSSSGDTVVHMSVTLIKASTKKALTFSGASKSKTFPFDTCSDGHKNGIETDVDCGGKCKTKCSPGQKCKKSDDCNGIPCAGNVCGSTSCKQFFDAGNKEPGFKEIIDLSTMKGETYYCKDGWTGSSGEKGVAAGWFQIDTCGHTRATGPNRKDCTNKLRGGSPRSDKQMLGWYQKNINYASASDFHRLGQTGEFQRWVAPRDVTVQLKLWGASGCVCYWWPSMVSKQGQGGYTYGTIDMKAGEQLYFIVGQKGWPGTNRPGGWGGGGKSWTENGVGGSSGSGGTHVFWRAKGDGAPPYPSNNGNDFRILVAGGAGATSTEECGNADNEDRHGGHGGGTTGDRGGWGNECGGGYGGTQSGPGAKGCNEGYHGGRYVGGRSARNDAGAGGGGYYGGGGGGYNSGGGGGSGYLGNHALECSGCPEPRNSASEKGKNELPARRENQRNPQGANGFGDMKGEGKIWFRYQ